LNPSSKAKVLKCTYYPLWLEANSFGNKRGDIPGVFLSLIVYSTNSQLRLDRFTFFNDKRFFVEFASEEQAQMALETLDGVEFMDKKLSVKPLKKDFVWGRVTHPDSGRSSRFFYEHDAAEGLKPLLEGRRMIFSVQPPGWLEDDSSVRHNKFALEVIEEYLGKYGVEAIGGMSPFFGDMKPHPRMLCLLDFTTTRGAEQAVEAIHETEIHGRKVWLQSSVASSWRAHQIGKVAPALLAELQEKGNASTTPYEDNFVKSDQKKGRENYHTTRTQRVEKKKARKAEEAQKAQ
jgi:RNA recognition motif-containing protein